MPSYAIRYRNRPRMKGLDAYLGAHQVVHSLDEAWTTDSLDDAINISYVHYFYSNGHLLAEVVELQPVTRVIRHEIKGSV